MQFGVAVPAYGSSVRGSAIPEMVSAAEELDSHLFGGQTILPCPTTRLLQTCSRRSWSPWPPAPGA